LFWLWCTTYAQAMLRVLREGVMIRSLLATIGIVMVGAGILGLSPALYVAGMLIAAYALAG